MQDSPETNNSAATATASATSTATATATATAAAPRTASLELVKELPRGSVGTVHQARNPQQDRNVVLRKFEVPEWLDDANDLLKKILAEAKAASALDHSNIARLYTCGYKDFTVFMTAEFVDGQTLRELMSKRQPEMSEVLNLTKQLCAALDAAHAKSVFHNFLNPCNIKVLSDGTLKVLDFGLLRDKNLLTQTPVKKLENEPYLSPEQVKNKPVDRAANIFSAAIILYELYTGRSPFHGKHLGEVDRSITDVDPHPLTMAHPRVPETISRVVLKALAKNPGERYESGEKFFAALEEASKAEPVARANATGSRPAYQGPGPSASQSMRAMQSPSASQALKVNQSMWNPPSPSASQSFKAVPAASQTQARAAMPETVYDPAGKTAARKPAPRAQNPLKLAGVVVGVLGVIVGLALMLRSPYEPSPENAAAQPASPAVSSPAPFSQQSSSEAATRTQAHTASSRTASAPKNVPSPSAPPAATEGQLIVTSVPIGAAV